MGVKTYNPYESVVGKNITRFQGVFNDGQGTSIPDSSVDFAKNASDRWRGAVQKRKGYSKFLAKNCDLNSIGQVFDGTYYQGDNEVYYRTELLVDYKKRPGYDDPWLDLFSGITFTPYTGVGMAEPSAESGSFTASGGYAGSESAPEIPGAQTWRYKHIAKAVNERRAMLGLPPSTLPTTRDDSTILYTDINAARDAVQGMYDYFVYDTVDPDKEDGGIRYSSYNDMLKRVVGGGSGEWTNYNAAGAIVYANDLTVTDLMTAKPYAKYCLELETVLRRCETYTFHGIPFKNYGSWAVGASNISPEDAWNNRRWQSSFDEWLITSVQVKDGIFYAGLGLPSSAYRMLWTVSVSSTLFPHQTNNYHRAIVPFLQYFNSGLPVEYKPSTAVYHDFTTAHLMPQPKKYYKVYTGPKTTAATMTGRYLDDGIFTIPINPVSNKYYVQALDHGVDTEGVFPGCFSHMHWFFPEDTKLGKKTP